MTPRSEDQIDREMDKIWDRVDEMGRQLATLIQQNSNIEASIKTMAEATGRALSNLTVCAERGVKLEDARERIRKIEVENISRHEFNNTVKTLREQIAELRKLLVRIGMAFGAPLAYLVVQQLFGGNGS